MEREYVWVVTRVFDNMVDEPILTAFDNETAAKKMYEEETRLGDHAPVYLDRVPLYHKYILE